MVGEKKEQCNLPSVESHEFAKLNDEEIYCIRCGEFRKVPAKVTCIWTYCTCVCCPNCWCHTPQIAPIYKPYNPYSPTITWTTTTYTPNFTINYA